MYLYHSFYYLAVDLKYMKVFDGVIAALYIYFPYLSWIIMLVHLSKLTLELTCLV